jgi:hypothetical protein
MPKPSKASRKANLEERAERIRDGFRKLPGFIDTLRASQADVRAGRFAAPEEFRRRVDPEAQ